LTSEEVVDGSSESLVVLVLKSTDATLETKELRRVKKAGILNLLIDSLLALGYG
jgi:hypothetical protein